MLLLVFLRNIGSCFPSTAVFSHFHEDMRLSNSVCFDNFYKLNLVQNCTVEPCEVVNECDVAEVLATPSVCAVFDDYETYLAYQDKYNFADFDVNDVIQIYDIELKKATL